MTKKKYQGRILDGIVLLDKPAGISSNATLQRAKRLFNAQKAGHTGSLDQLATGLLPLCFGKATKIASYLINADKRYHAICQFGQISNTGDLEGELTEIDSAAAAKLTLADIERILPQFLGKQLQIPPMHSAIKYQGKRLYKLAHKGKEIERQPRPIEIFELKIISFKAPQLELEVHCAKGTYIRTLVEDIGKALHCGAVLQQLRRIAVGQYQQMVGFDHLERAATQGIEQLDQHILSIDTALKGYPQLQLSLAEMNKLYFGQRVFNQDFTVDQLVCLTDEAQRWCGFARLDAKLQIRPIVFMPPEL